MRTVAAVQDGSYGGKQSDVEVERSTCMYIIQYSIGARKKALCIEATMNLKHAAVSSLLRD